MSRTVRLRLLLCGMAVLCLAALWFIPDRKHSTEGPIDISVSLVKEYASAVDLREDADIVAEVTVEGASAFRDGTGSVYTRSSVRVVRSYQGDADTLQILETGGEWDGKTYTLFGNRTLAEGDRAVVFLQKYSGSVDLGPAAEDVYMIVGTYLGRFMVDADGTLEPPREAGASLQSIPTVGELLRQAGL